MPFFTRNKNYVARVTFSPIKDDDDKDSLSKYMIAFTARLVEIKLSLGMSRHP